MPRYTPPRRLPTMRQCSPSTALMRAPQPDGRPEIIFDHHSPTEFMHEHYMIRLSRRLARSAGGEILEITAQVFLSVPAAGAPCRIAVAPEDESRVQEMMWRAMDDAVLIADRCLDVLRQVAPQREKQIARAEGR